MEIYNRKTVFEGTLFISDEEEPEPSQSTANLRAHFIQSRLAESFKGFRFVDAPRYARVNGSSGHGIDYRSDVDVDRIEADKIVKKAISEYNKK